MNDRSRLLVLLAIVGCSVTCGSLRAGPASAGTIVNGVEVGGSVTSPPLEPGRYTPPLRPASWVAINFDEFPEPTGLFAYNTPLRSAYSALGVTFSGPGPLDGGAVLNEYGGFGVSGYSSPNFVAFNSVAVMANGGHPAGPERLEFAMDVSTVEVGIASGYGTAMVLRVYDASLNLLAVASATPDRLMKMLSVSAPGIRFAEIEAVGAQAWVFDNLGFESSIPTGVTSPSWGRVKAAYR